ncbi:MCE family protein [Mycobacterium sp.]|uniref:MCE family protein n=1 Tax=Mycobacterium sp. TaxID=1785 RepID=UPI003A8B9010
MRVLTEFNRGRVGLLGMTVTLLVVAVAQSFTSVPVLFATPMYYAKFADTGGISTGDQVRIAGVNVGLVRSLVIQGDKVLIGFTLADKTIGTASRVSIRTDTLLGRRNIKIEPRGSQVLRPNGVLPPSQTSTPYQVYDAFVDATDAATGWDIGAVKRSLEVLSETFDQTAPHLGAALDGIKEFSSSIGERGEQIKQLLENANKIGRVLGDRSQQINGLLVNSGTLLAAFKQRSQALKVLLSNVTEASEQLKTMFQENPNINRMLRELGTVSDELVKRKTELSEVLTLFARYSAALTEAVGSGPYFKAIVVNLIPPQMLQPFVDAAFKKRGIDPEEFWRSAGLPAFRFPDPNGTRSANGAPPPGPVVLEGTPEHPLPAVPPGSPCSYTPSADARPGPENPLPCAMSDQGPFGPIAGGFPAPLDVRVSAPTSEAPPAAPGVPAAGRPGEIPPSVPGMPVPFPADAPPGARTEPVGPAATGGGTK